MLTLNIFYNFSIVDFQQVNVSSQPAITCLKLTKETLEGVKYVQS